MRRVLITGSSGLIGVALGEALAGSGYDPVGVDCRPSSGTRICHMLTWEDARIAQLIADVDGIVHLAATSRVIAAQADPTECWNNNVRLTASIVRAVSAAPHKPWMIYASSREVYGQAAILPATDHTPLAPLNIYGSSKAAAEALVEQAILQFELNAAILRFSTVYGGIQDHADRVMPAFVLGAMKRKPLTVCGEKVILDPTWLGDVVQAILTLIVALFEHRRPTRPLLLSGGTGITLADLARLVCKTLASHSRIAISPARTYDAQTFFGGSRYAEAFLGWRPRTSLADGIRAYRDMLEAGGLPHSVVSEPSKPAMCSVDRG